MVKSEHSVNLFNEQYFYEIQSSIFFKTEMKFVKNLDEKIFCENCKVLNVDQVKSDASEDS